MSDDPSSLKELAQSAIEGNGWLVAVLTSTWAVVLRIIVGSILADRKQIRVRLTHIERLMARQDERLKNIEMRSTFRRQGDEQALLGTHDERDEHDEEDL